jgi:hypothetical protein
MTGSICFPTPPLKYGAGGLGRKYIGLAAAGSLEKRASPSMARQIEYRLSTYPRIEKSALESARELPFGSEPC